MTAMLQVRGLSGEEEGGVVRDFTYLFRAAEAYALAAPNEKENSLLLRLLSLLKEPEAGRIWVNGEEIDWQDRAQLGRVRNRCFGFLFTSPFLLPAFTVLENVAMPLFKVSDVEPAQAAAITAQTLELVGLTQRAESAIERLDPLEQHLAALARAVVHSPQLIVADRFGAGLEPGDLAALHARLRQVADRLGVTLILTSAVPLSALPMERLVRVNPARTTN